MENNNWFIAFENSSISNLSKKDALKKFKRIKKEGACEAALYEGDTFIDKTDFVSNLL